MKIRDLDEAFKESMSFSAGHKDKEKGYWTSDTDPGSPYCLLYTSPSPRDGLLSRMPSSA